MKLVSSLGILLSSLNMTSPSNYQLNEFQLDNISKVIENVYQEPKVFSLVDMKCDLLGNNRYALIKIDSNYMIYDVYINDLVQLSPLLGQYEYDIYGGNNLLFRYNSDTIINSMTNNILSEDEYQTYLDYQSTYINNMRSTQLNYNNKTDGYKEIANADYFKKLYSIHNTGKGDSSKYDYTAYFHNNTDGSCPTVALQIYLMYLDTFYDERIVKEEWEVIDNNDTFSYDWHDYKRSPGSKDELWQSFITYGKNLGIFAADAIEFGSNYENTFKIAKAYLTDRFNSSATSLFSFNYEDTNDINRNKQLVKDAIDSGFPVMVAGNLENKDDNSSHIGIAYAYSNEYVYLHSGYYVDDSNYDDNKIWLFVTNFSLLTGEATIKPKSSQHIHAANYKSNSSYLCTCGAVGESNHICTYITYRSVSTNYHNAICWCGIVKKQMHDFNLDPLVDECVCGATKRYYDEEEGE